MTTLCEFIVRLAIYFRDLQRYHIYRMSQVSIVGGGELETSGRNSDRERSSEKNDQTVAI